MSETKHILICFFVIATWTAHWREPVTCGINEPKYNSYTGKMEVSRFEYAVYCEESRESKMKKEFNSIEEFEKFKVGCSTEPILFGTGVWCDNWEWVVYRSTK